MNGSIKDGKGSLTGWDSTLATRDTLQNENSLSFFWMAVDVDDDETKSFFFSCQPQVTNSSRMRRRRTPSKQEKKKDPRKPDFVL
mmetsp:Transcript_17497/g.32803  ORF Transcript_17497/g.32803 Transcript_17497/m.32803 type:complete len:85 (+) Transcript_17497:1231-1485(+)